MGWRWRELIGETGLTLLVATFMLCAAAASASDSCDVALKTRPDTPFPYRPFANRCEGFYEAPSSGSLEILSLLTHPIRFDWRPDVVLEVTAPTVRQPIKLRAAAVPPQTNYRLDATLDPNGRLSWPIKDVLYPAGLHADRIAALGWRMEGKYRWLLPVRVAQAGKPESSSPPAPFLVFRPSVDIDSIRTRWGPVGADLECGARTAWETGNPSRASKWQPVPLVIPADRPRTLCLDIAARAVSDGQWIGPIVLHLRLADQ